MTPYSHTISGRARFADLDPQRHVTSRTYEYFAYEARHRLLEQHDYPLQRLLDEQIRFRPRAGYVRFVNQQYPDNEMHVPAAAYPTGDGRIIWDHALRQPDDAPICRIVQELEAVNAAGEPIDLLAERAEPETELRDFLHDIPAFGGQCKRLSLEYQSLMSDRSVSGDYAPGALWRIFEDGRTLFGERIGLTYELIQEIDTTLFFMGATFHYFQAIAPGTPLRIHSWLERTDKIRAYMRQDVTDLSGETLYMSAQEEHLIVSLSRSRPRRAPQQFYDMFGDYTEFPDS
ncbi:MAG: acyl-[acyl-carrier-protein] thioesterase [bacterium]|nr:acyl-[acyl-carrier-protein] thioesterase [bacterium]